MKNERPELAVKFEFIFGGDYVQRSALKFDNIVQSNSWVATHAYNEKQFREAVIHAQVERHHLEYLFWSKHGDMKGASFLTDGQLIDMIFD